MKLSFSEVASLVDRIEDAGGRWDLLREIVMPNGEAIKGGTREYMHELAGELELFAIEHADELAANDRWEELQ
jgi:hypothetical protein